MRIILTCLILFILHSSSQQMAEFRETENGWNIYTNKPCSDGTYFYIASVTNITGTQKTLHGFITLVK